MKIIVDADACPKTVLKICMELGQKYSIPVWTVASFNHQITSDHHILVGNASQEVDLKVMNICEKGDIVVTQDWGLAAVVLSKGAISINPFGSEYKPDKIDFMLEEREIKAKFRRSGGRTKGPKKRIRLNDECFLSTLEHCIKREKGLGSEERD